MKRVALICLSTVVVLLQLSLLPALRPFGVVPNAVLALVVLVGLEGTVSVALVVALAGGLVLDLASGANFGLWTGLLVVAALTAGLIRRAGIELSSAVVGPVMVAVGTLVMTLMILVGLVNTATSWPAGYILGHFGIELMLNLLITVGLRPVVAMVTPGTPPETAIR